ncbi:MAG: BLUF domain-containing protein [Methyloversatilis sp.]|nr:BLUF domain-containing protein [Methyloversatilis sp.]
MMTFQIVYSSQATGLMTAAELEQILVDARAGNEARNVTGALVFVDGVFLQILEGEEGVVRSLMANIARDTRHDTVTVFHEAEVEAPTFGTWRMAYVSATPQDMSAWAGLPGTATVDALLKDIGRDPHRVPQILASILRHIAG